MEPLVFCDTMRRNLAVKEFISTTLQRTVIIVFWLERTSVHHILFHRHFSLKAVLKLVSEAVLVPWGVVATKEQLRPHPLKQHF